MVHSLKKRLNKKPCIPLFFEIFPCLGPTSLKDLSQADAADRLACGSCGRHPSVQIPVGEVPSGKHTKNYGKSPFIVDFPMKNGDFP
jgi:hypothetical protein